MAITDAELFSRLKEVLESGWFEIPDKRGYRGTGAPGLILEELLGIGGGNFDIPDAGRWEIKYHGGSSPITLFHKTAEPEGHMYHMVRKFGQADHKQRLSFRHTLHEGQSNLGLQIFDESERITVRHPNVSGMTWPYWTHDTLTTAFASKLRRLIVVDGRKSKGRVCYGTAHLYEHPRTTQFVKEVANGTVYIDFDARTQKPEAIYPDDKGGLRDHGTKFRIKRENLEVIYSSCQKFTG